MPTIMQIGNGTPRSRKDQAVTIKLTARTAPTDRSMPPVMMTSAAPTDMMPISEIWLNTSTRFLTVRK